MPLIAARVSRFGVKGGMPKKYPLADVVTITRPAWALTDGGFMNDTAYNDRTDLQKIQSQWNKIGGLLGRGRDWSAAIVRAATAAEIAANVAVRQRFVGTGFQADFVDSLLKWANGIDGKFTRLIIPSEVDQVRRDQLSTLKVHADRINQKRNEIVHRGAFADKPEAEEIIGLARIIIDGLVRHYHPEFVLRDKPSEPKAGKSE